MSFSRLSYLRTKKKYLKFLKSQEIRSEPFRDKLGQLDNFYLPISKMITAASNSKNDFEILSSMILINPHLRFFFKTGL